MCKQHATYRWKAFNDGYNFALDLIAIRGLHKKLCAYKAVRILTVGISSRDSHLGVQGQKTIWMWPPWRGAEYTIRGKVVASPKSEPW